MFELASLSFSLASDLTAKKPKLNGDEYLKRESEMYSIIRDHVQSYLERAADTQHSEFLNIDERSLVRLIQSLTIMKKKLILRIKFSKQKTREFLNYE